MGREIFEKSEKKNTIQNWRTATKVRLALRSPECKVVLHSFWVVKGLKFEFFL